MHPSPSSSSHQTGRSSVETSLGQGEATTTRILLEEKAEQGRKEMASVESKSGKSLLNSGRAEAKPPATALTRVHACPLK